MKNFTLLILLSSLLFSCKSTSEIVDTPIFELDYFIIGQGGGITGEYVEYEVLSSGEVNLMDWETQKHNYYHTLSESQISSIFTSLNDIDWASIDYVKPGNWTSYVAIKINDGKLHRVVWADPNSPNKNVKAFFDTVYPSLKKRPTQ